MSGPSSENQDSLRQRIQSGTRAMLFVQIASQLVSLIVLGVLYRQVDRQAFGLMGMVLPIIMLPRMVTSYGLSVAAIQKHQISVEQRSNLFWLNLLLGVGASGLSAALAPVFAWIYGAPELVPVCLALSASSLVMSAGAQHQASLERDLQLWRLAVLRLVAQLAGGIVAVATAYSGWGIWALVIQQYVELVLLTVAVIFAAGWRPRRPQRVAMRELVHFGGHYSLSMLLFFIVLHADKIVLSWMFGATESGRVVIGLYNQAFQLMMKPVYLVTTPVTGIMLPALSRAKDDPRLFGSLTLNFFRMTSIALLPCGVGLAVVSQDAMLLLGGEAWRDAGVLLGVLAPVVLVKGHINICGSVFAALGRADRLSFGAAIQTMLIAQAAFMAYFISQQLDSDMLSSAYNMAVGYTLTTLAVIAFPYLYFCFRTARIPLGPVFRQSYRALVSSCAMGVLVWYLNRWLTAEDVEVPMRFTLSVVAGVAVYLILARNEVRWLAQQLGSGR